MLFNIVYKSLYAFLQLCEVGKFFMSESWIVTIILKTSSGFSFCLVREITQTNTYSLQRLTLLVCQHQDGNNLFKVLSSDLVIVGLCQLNKDITTDFFEKIFAEPLGLELDQAKWINVFLLDYVYKLLLPLQIRESRDDLTVLDQLYFSLEHHELSGLLHVLREHTV